MDIWTGSLLIFSIVSLFVLWTMLRYYSQTPQELVPEGVQLIGVLIIIGNILGWVYRVVWYIGSLIV